MSIAQAKSGIVAQLMDAGIIPPMCRRWSLNVEPGAVLVMRSEVFISEEQFEKVAAALLANPEEAKLIQEATFIEIGARERKVTAK